MTNAKSIRESILKWLRLSDEKLGTPLSFWKDYQDDPSYFAKNLSSKQHSVLRNSGTEYPSSSYYNKHCVSSGHYACRACGLPLYTAKSKFDSGSGWPAFGCHIQGNVETKDDYSLRVKRTEVHCARCQSHLGHVFAENSSQRIDRLKSWKERQCINGVCLQYVEDDAKYDTETALSH